MKDAILRTALLVALPTLTWMGFVQGVDGALYVVKFFVWGMCLPLGLLALSDFVQNELAKKPPPSALHRWLARATAWGVLGTMVWTGHIGTGLAWGFYMLCCAVASEGMKKRRAEISAAQSA